MDPRGASDDRYRCQQVNLVAKSKHTNELEYLFAPYSTFEVTKVELQATPTHQKPHRIYVKAAMDNREESELLPLLTWH